MSPIYNNRSQLTTLYMTCLKKSLDTFYQSSLTSSHYTCQSCTWQIRAEKLGFPCIGNDASQNERTSYFFRENREPVLVKQPDRHSNEQKIWIKKSGMFHCVLVVRSPRIWGDVPQLLNRTLKRKRNIHEISSEFWCATKYTLVVTIFGFTIILEMDVLASVISKISLCSPLLVLFLVVS